MDEDILKILKKHFYPDNNVIDTLYDIADTEINKQQRVEYRSILSTMVDCYQYGVIMGKRQERARHEKCNIELSKCKLY